MESLYKSNSPGTGLLSSKTAGVGSLGKSTGESGLPSSLAFAWLVCFDPLGLPSAPASIFGPFDSEAPLESCFGKSSAGLPLVVISGTRGERISGP